MKEKFVILSKSQWVMELLILVFIMLEEKKCSYTKVLGELDVDKEFKISLKQFCGWVCVWRHMDIVCL